MNEQYVANDLALIFTINEIADSRCPTGAYRFWQGEARMKIVIENPVADTLEMSTFDCLSASTGNYEFQLLDVSSYPAIYIEIEITV